VGFGGEVIVQPFVLSVSKHRSTFLDTKQDSPSTSSGRTDYGTLWIGWIVSRNQ
jgi:hypothetical protein